MVSIRSRIPMSALNRGSTGRALCGARRSANPVHDLNPHFDEAGLFCVIWDGTIQSHPAVTFRPLIGGIAVFDCGWYASLLVGRPCVDHCGVEPPLLGP